MTQLVSAARKVKFWPYAHYAPHAGQQAIHGSDVRHRLASCGRRFGKSTAGGKELVAEAVRASRYLAELETFNQQLRYWIVGPNYSDAEKEWRVYHDTCRKLRLPMDRPGTYNDPHGGNMQMSLYGGKFVVECRSGAHPESLVGEGLHGVLMVEAAKLKQDVWHKYVRPALAENRGWSLHTSTPEGKNHFYEQWQLGQDPDNKEWASWRMPSWVNELVFPDGRDDPEVLALENDMSPERFNQEIAALFTEFVGRVFKGFDEEVHVRDLSYDAALPLYAGVDYGYTNPFVWLDIQVDVWGDVRVLGEYYAQGRDINDLAKDLMAGGRSNVKRFYPDPADPGSTLILSKALRAEYERDTGGELAWRLELIRQWLKPQPLHVPEEDRRPRLLIDRSCVNLIREMLDYRYPERKNESQASPEKPLPVDDHGPEALGRFMRGYFGGPNAPGQGRKIRQTRARMTSR